MKKTLFFVISIILVFLVGCSSIPSVREETTETLRVPSPLDTEQEINKSEATISEDSEQGVLASSVAQQYKTFDSFGYDVEGEDLNALAEALYASDEFYGSYRLYDTIGRDTKTLSGTSQFNEYRKMWTKINIGLDVAFDFSVDPKMYIFFLKEGVPGVYSQVPIGSRGPSGGYVFYDKGYYSDGWRFLEVAPNDISRPVIGYNHEYAKSSYHYFNLDGATSAEIGFGQSNTDLIIQCMESSNYKWNNNYKVKTNEYAAKVCDVYELNGYDDWFLPSKQELFMVYSNLFLNGIGDFFDDYYWSSTVEGNAALEFERAYRMNKFEWYGGQGYCRVRPVRSF